MYLQITDHCNMFCDHCGFSCGPRKKNFMPLEVAKKALNEFCSEYITIGGGEPTCHPDFLMILGYASVVCTEAQPHVITNGKNEYFVRKLSFARREGNFTLEISKDEFHEPLSPGMDKFVKNNKLYRENKHGRISKRGRAIKTGVWTEDYCICEDILIDPHGDIYQCGCKGKKGFMGNIMTLSNKELLEGINMVRDFESEKGSSCIRTK